MLKLRVATVEDACSIAEIYKYYVENTVASFEYIAPDAKEFSKRISHKLEKYPFIVAEDDGNIIGYAYASEFRERTAYNWDAELSIYLDNTKCQKGIGTRLYSALLELLRIQNFATLYSGITYPNDASVALHKKFGFESAGTFHAVGYKHNRWLDVMWYEKRIAYMESPKPIIPFPDLDKALVEKILNN